MDAKVENKKVKVGDWVGFKCDTEQSGQIIKIEKGSNFRYNGMTLTLKDEDGFRGDYIGGMTETEVYSNDCWL